MGITRAPQVHVVYAECNSPSSPDGDDPLPWDTFYDETQSVVAGAALTAALAAIGLTFASNAFTATRAGIYAIHLAFGAVTAPALQGSEVRLNTPGYIADPRTQWGTGHTEENNPPPNGQTDLQTTFYMAAGQAFHARSLATGTVTDGVIDYAALSIIRLV